MEQIFPELTEPEDEKIRKELIEHIKANRDTSFVLFQKFSPDDVIDWLEKQGEKKSVECSEEDKEQCNLLIWQLANLKHTLALDFRNEIKWLKSLKQRVEEQR